jgi:DNA-nicking Smr family endonuclease
MSNPFERLQQLRDSLPSRPTQPYPQDQKSDIPQNQQAGNLSDKKSKTRLKSSKKKLQEKIIFQKAMQDVIPFKKPSKRVVPAPPEPDSFELQAPMTEDQEVICYLNHLIAGQVDFDINFKDEIVEGAARGLPPQILQNLREGLYPIQDHLDLHGKTAKEAHEALKTFIPRATTLGKRCLLLIHGRGNGSPNKISVLKLNLSKFLLTNPLKRYVLAFTTAQPIDGGLGATYVLLKKYTPCLF